MARIRTIKPGHVNDKELSKVSLNAHLFWILSWCFSDDEGVFENDPLLLKSQIFPRRTDIRVEQVEQWLGQLSKARFIIPFTHNGEGYYIHRTFTIHQKIDRPQPSKIPQEIIRRTLDECSTSARPCIGEDSIVRDRKGEDEALPTHSPDLIKKFKAFNDWLTKNAPNVQKLKEPFTIDQYEKLQTDFPGQNEAIRNILLAMHNKADLLKKYTSANLTLRNWIKKEPQANATVNGNNGHKTRSAVTSESARFILNSLQQDIVELTSTGAENDQP